MWILSNDTPFAAERTLVSDKNGADVWVVAVKGTYNISSKGALEIAEKQEPVLQAPRHKGDPVKTSLLYESDLNYAKPATDIVLHGHAYAPKGRPCRDVDVTLQVGELRKTLRVFGDRIWKSGIWGPSIGKPNTFERMPIEYEKAFGGADLLSDDPRKHGWESRNLVGVGFVTKAKHLIDQPAPNIEDPKNLISSWNDKFSPAGFGPIARHWTPRRELAGTYDDRWQNERLPLLPMDFDERFFQFAPPDQQTSDYLKGGEPVVLQNLTPEGYLQFNLPRVSLAFRTILGGKGIEHRANIHAVIFELDVPRVIIVWQTMLPCHGQRESLVSTSVVRKSYVGKGQLVSLSL